jgi:hypothetical protein
MQKLRGSYEISEMSQLQGVSSKIEIAYTAVELIVQLLSIGNMMRIIRLGNRTDYKSVLDEPTCCV